MKKYIKTFRLIIATLTVGVFIGQFYQPIPLQWRNTLPDTFGYNADEIENMNMMFDDNLE